MKSDCAILILSCDKYSDLWDPFFRQFWKHWADCPFPVYLGSNTIAYTGEGKVKTVASGKDVDWSTSFQAILRKIPETYLFVWLEDAFIISAVDSEKFFRCFHFMRKVGAKHIHGRPLSPSDISHDATYVMHDKGAPYRVSVIGFWDRRYLQTVLLPGENMWNFEIMGSYRASYTDGFYCPSEHVFKYVHLVEKGKWLPDAMAYCKKHAIAIPWSNRESITGEKRIKSAIQSSYFNLVTHVHWKYRVQAMNVLRKLLVSY